jgi:hypothetical protein
VEHFVEHPWQLSDTERSFGHVEIRTSKDGEALARWPMFYKRNKKATFSEIQYTVYMPDQEKMIITESYRLEEYHLPLEKKISIFRPDGTLRRETVYTRIP